MCYKVVPSKTLLRTMRCLVAASCFAASLLSQNTDQAKTVSSSSTLRAKGVLGLEGVADNSTGTLSIQDDVLVFSRGEGAVVKIPLNVIQDVFLSQQDKQVGGTAMALGQAAVPFQGGRLIGVFSHKKYDFVTLEYFDSNGGFHGTVYELNKGQGQVLADNLGAKGVHVGAPEIDNSKHETEATNAK